jgi:predicted Rossmann fold nucleotide-binding protein DprA/Smf involved in DNA uptake
LNTVHRPPAEDFALAVPMPQLVTLKNVFTGHVEIISESEHAGVDSLPPSHLQDDELMALISRRPCSAEDVASGLGIHINEALKHLERLNSDGKAKVLITGGRAFYTAVSGREVPMEPEEKQSK